MIKSLIPHYRKQVKRPNYRTKLKNLHILSSDSTIDGKQIEY